MAVRWTSDNQPLYKINLYLKPEYNSTTRTQKPFQFTVLAVFTQEDEQCVWHYVRLCKYETQCNFFIFYN